MEWVVLPEAWIALLTLTILEIVLGIDNIIFITILADKLPEQQQARARRLGLLLAMGARIALLFSISWVVSLTNPWFTVLGQEISGRDLLMLGGGLFLLGKATAEIHDNLEGESGHAEKRVQATMAAVLAQIFLLDLVFSLDSVITAVGMADHIAVMVIAVVVSIGIMILAAERISTFVGAHPTVKILALAFLLLVGMSLVAEAFEQHIPKGYIYFAMGFSIFVEALNLRIRSNRRAKEPVPLRRPYDGSSTKAARSDGPAGDA